jgi:hypothetical protein
MIDDHALDLGIRAPLRIRTVDLLLTMNRRAVTQPLVRHDDQAEREHTPALASPRQASREHDLPLNLPLTSILLPQQADHDAVNERGLGPQLGQPQRLQSRAVDHPALVVQLALRADHGHLEPPVVGRS